MMNYAWLATVYPSEVVIKELQEIIFTVVIFDIVSLQLFDAGQSCDNLGIILSAEQLL
jgi:hypothetical protein